MRWFRLQRYSLLSGLKLWADEPLGNLFNALVLAVALALPWTLVQGLSAIVPSMDRWVGAPEISLYFAPQAQISDIRDAQTKLQRDFDLDEVRLVTPEDALQQLRNRSENPDLAQSLATNPLPYTIVVVLAVDSATDTNQIDTKIAQWKTFSGVDHVQFDAQWLQRLQSILAGTQTLSMALGLIIATLVLVVTFNTVRLQLLNKQQEVSVLKALGATDTEVGRPTLWWSISLALVAFVLAYGAVSGAMNLADTGVGPWIRQFDRDFVFPQPEIITALGLVLAWIALVMVGAWASVKATVLRFR